MRTCHFPVRPVEHGKKCRSCARGGRALSSTEPCPLVPSKLQGKVAVEKTV